MSDERKTREPATPGSPTEAASEPAPSEATPSDGGSSPDSTSPQAEREADSKKAEAQTVSTSGDSPSSDHSADANTSRDTEEAAPAEPTKAVEPQAEPGVYFFTDRLVTAAEARQMLASDSVDERAEVVSRLLTYAEYDEIWTWTDRDTVRELFDRLELPDRLKAAWARNLGLVVESA